MALETVSEWKRARETIRDYVQEHPGCRMQDIVAETKYTYTEIAGGVIEYMVYDGRLERWWSYGVAHFYIQGAYKPMPTTNAPKEHEKTGDKHIEAYLDAFDAFCDECMERYDAGVIGNLTPEAMISLYRGFLTALPAIKKAGERK
ncbi:MAG: hypothetical protein GWP10_21150 [Nitrospiraceae bacterium]|nr:hypothetical protein [Nitrospiraceae bacterium]